ncbi:hypothetical protein EMCG_05912 [[Emmonsia] crescens]|uniref:HNH nuclease domain-containing protein n=1 Tax=[Emmonsia] crescens TaxID=73230 RepID=A0A0G2ID09_9EURO|nr:hypothetical protein EMCG_05912 [Emmonsia crescens UAMH 3008]
MQSTAVDDSPDATFRCEERRELLRQIKEILKCEVSPTAWAFLWLSDLTQLRQIVQLMQGSNLVAWAAVLTATDLGLVGNTTGIRAHHTKVLAPAESESTPTTPTRTARSATADAKCRERDQNQCVLTRYFHPIDVAHIYPLAMNKEQRTGTASFSFWNILELFWSKERVDAWYNAIFPRGTEVVENRLCFAPHVRRWHEKGLFALRPIGISDDGTKLTVKFFWLSQRLPSHTIDILETPTLLPEDPAHLPKNFRVWNAETQALIKCGDEIVLETHNPDTHPLPDVRLLEMQWMLQQLTALSGAAEVNDSFRPEDDDDWEDDAFSYDEYGYDNYADESPEPLRLPELILPVG